MKAMKCDRCGKYYDISLFDYYRHDKVASYKNDDPKVGKDVYDLCPECMDEFRRFMDAKLVGEG